MFQKQLTFSPILRVPSLSKSLQVLCGFLYAFVSPQLPFLLLAVTAAPFAILVMFKVYEPTVKEV
ncbi:MAG: hypothetical protein FJ045_03230 [Crenarchaeota archaeon]|nr:hypothetical protein [Thermoproteota archaeon]